MEKEDHAAESKEVEAESTPSPASPTMPISAAKADITEEEAVADDSSSDAAPIEEKVLDSSVIGFSLNSLVFNVLIFSFLKLPITVVKEHRAEAEGEEETTESAPLPTEADITEEAVADDSPIAPIEEEVLNSQVGIDQFCGSILRDNLPIEDLASREGRERGSRRHR